MGLVRSLQYVIPVALLIYALIDCIQTDAVLIRNLPKTIWIFMIILIPVIGPIVWLVAGRPQPDQRRRPVPWPSTATAGFPEYERPRPPRGPDDDAAFLSRLGGPDPEKEELLARWEAQLREREERLRQAPGDDAEGRAPDGPDAARETGA
jgi:hypothetical protein